MSVPACRVGNAPSLGNPAMRRVVWSSQPNLVTAVHDWCLCVWLLALFCLPAYIAHLLACLPGGPKFNSPVKKKAALAATTTTSGCAEPALTPLQTGDNSAVARSSTQDTK